MTQTHIRQVLNAIKDAPQSELEQLWTLLSALYLKENMHRQAAYCLEEVLLYNPSDWRVFHRLGDIYMTLKFHSSAKNYYCRSLALLETESAWKGILAACQGSNHPKDAELIKVAQNRLLKIKP